MKVKHCPACKGKGLVYKPSFSSVTGKHRLVFTCEDCKGTGRITVTTKKETKT